MVLLHRVNVNQYRGRVGGCQHRNGKSGPLLPYVRVVMGLEQAELVPLRAAAGLTDRAQARPAMPALQAAFESAVARPRADYLEADPVFADDFQQARPTSGPVLGNAGDQVMRKSQVVRGLLKWAFKV